MCEKILSAFVTNLGKYSEGELIGAWLDFPTTDFELKMTLLEIGINKQYEEVFITDYESDIEGLCGCLGEYENLYALNFLAEKIEESGCTTEQIEALIDYGECTGSLEELVTLLDNVDCFLMYSEVENDYDLGYYYIHELGLLQEMKDSVLANYIDYEAYGRDVRLEEGGVYTVNDYYVCMIDGFNVDSDYLSEVIQNGTHNMRAIA